MGHCTPSAILKCAGWRVASSIGYQADWQTARQPPLSTLHWRWDVAGECPPWAFPPLSAVRSGIGHKGKRGEEKITKKQKKSSKPSVLSLPSLLSPYCRLGPVITSDGDPLRQRSQGGAGEGRGCMSRMPMLGLSADCAAACCMSTHHVDGGGRGNLAERDIMSSVDDMSCGAG